MAEERRSKVFIERLSMTLVIMAAVGAMLVLIDPQLSLALPNGTVLKFGGDGFSNQLKGAVITLILVSGYAAVIGYWLGASNTGVKAQESVNTIATAAADTAAAGVTGTPIKTDQVNVETANTVVKEKP